MTIRVYLCLLLTSLLLSACGHHSSAPNPNTTTAPNTTAPNQGNLNHGFVAQQQSAQQWWNIPYPQSFDAASLSKPQAWVSVKGKGFVADGKPFIFRGVNIADPGKLAGQGRWNKALFEEVHHWGANTIRIPIHPIAWRQHGSDWVLARLDEAVHWANSLDMYLIIDWHSIGNLEAELYQHVMYETTQLETRQFWRTIALRYRQVPTVAVYEIFNEPTHNYIGVGDYSLGKASWESWRRLLEEYIDLIRVYNPRAIPLVGGYNWAYDLTPIAKAPVRRTDIAYAIHPYPQKAKPEVPSRENFFALWEQTWGYVADSYPMIATELGWSRSTDYGAHVPVIDDSGTYGPNIIDYMAKKGISYTAWVFDPDWSPMMIKDWNFTPTEQGAFFKAEMRKARGDK